ncbi:hypothetical protein B0J14DRAFT_695877 [Halenospora varia]|nr:hypothetical protein B0J14DRAFT_695877 [Halenospora varia]
MLLSIVMAIAPALLEMFGFQELPDAAIELVKQVLPHHSFSPTRSDLQQKLLTSGKIGNGGCLDVFASELPDPERWLFKQSCDDLRKFELFPRLPSELRLLIWQFTFEQPIWKFEDLHLYGIMKYYHITMDKRFFPSNMKPPATLTVCKESRTEIISLYFKDFWGDLPPVMQSVSISLIDLVHFRSFLHPRRRSRNGWISNNIMHRPGSWLDTVEVIEIQDLYIKKDCGWEDIHQRLWNRVNLESYLDLLFIFKNLKKVQLAVRSSCELEDFKDCHCQDSVLKEREKVGGKVNNFFRESSNSAKFVDGKGPKVEINESKWFPRRHF